ncbi:MAG: hypothetical protein SPG40_03950 [Kiritimatiellia bacterium]|nr:hypothetical protein [Kiritimatiellia bacterium]
MLKAAVLFFAPAALLCSAFAEEPEIMSGSYSNPLKFDVESASTLSAELAGRGVTTLEQLNAYDAILKGGAGVLTVDGDLIAGFAGEIHVLKGSWKASANGHLGTAAGKTYVHGDGAELWLAGTSTAVSYQGEEIVFYGTGVRHGYDGQGAIYHAGGSFGNNNYAFGTKWTLAGDAQVQISATNPYLNLIEVDFGGHTLTLWPGPYGKVSNSQNLGAFKSYANPGHLILSTGEQMSVNPSNGSAENTATYYKSMTRVDDFWTSPWTFIIDTDSIIQSTMWSTKDLSAKSALGRSGPIVLKQDVALTDNYGKYPGQFSFTATGVVSGPGGIRVRSNHMTLHLDNAENCFQGGVTLPDGDVLKLYAPGSLPANGGALVMTNAAVAFASADEYALPDLEVVGTGLVSQATGTWKQVKKVGEGALVWESMLSANELFVDGGTVLLPKSLYKASDYCGFNLYITGDMTGGNTFEQIKRTGTKTTNASYGNVGGVGGVKGYSPLFLVNNIGSNADIPAGGAVGYEGWVWCDDADGTAWTFIVCYGDKNTFYLKIGDETLWNFDNASGYVTDVSRIPRKNVRMKHGWNHFEAAALKGWTGTSSNGGEWPVGHAFKVDRQGSATSVYTDYEFLFDEGDGRVIVSELDDGVSFVPSFPSIRLGAGVLDLNGTDYTFGWMRGTGSTANGNLTVTGGWRLDCSETAFADWRPAQVNGKLTFGAEARIKVENPSAWPKSYDITLLTAEEPIETLPTVEVPAGWNRPVRAALSADRKSISLSCHVGLVIGIR